MTCRPATWTRRGLALLLTLSTPWVASGCDDDHSSTDGNPQDAPDSAIGDLADSSVDSSTAMPCLFGCGPRERVSVSSDGAETDWNSYSPSLSDDGREVAFHSSASNLVDGDTNGTRDVFVHDRELGRTERASVSSDGEQANAFCVAPSLSADGRFVAFYSPATNLVSMDSNGGFDVFVRDRLEATTERVTVNSTGDQATGDSWAPSLSGDGRFVAFVSNADNLAPGDTNSANDVFVYDRQAGETERVSVASGGVQVEGHSRSPSISGDGRFVAFVSSAAGFVPNDTNDADDVFVHDRLNETTERVSLASSGREGTSPNEQFDVSSAVISADGRFVVFSSLASTLVVGDTNGLLDIFVRDRETGTTQRVNVGPGQRQAFGGETRFPTVSRSGQFVVFESDATSLVASDTNVRTDVFVHDRSSSVTERISVDDTGSQALGGLAGSQRAVISDDGRVVAFQSDAPNLVTVDTNSAQDIFVVVQANSDNSQ